MPFVTLTANSSHVNYNLDTFLFQHLGAYKLTKPQIKQLILNGFVTKNKVTISKQGFKVKNGDTFEVNIETEEELEKSPEIDDKLEDEEDANNVDAADSALPQLKKPKKKKKKHAVAKDAQQDLDENEADPNNENAVSLVEPHVNNKLEGKPFPLNIVYQDDDIAVINKPAGLIVHPAPHNVNSVVTLAHALVHTFGHENLSHVEELEEQQQQQQNIDAAAAAAADHAEPTAGYLRPGMVHRIDADTSGLIVIAKKDAAHIALKNQFLRHSISRKYTCLVMNEMLYDEGVIESEITRNPSMPSKRNATALKHILPGNENSDFNVNNTKQLNNDFYNIKEKKKNAKFARSKYHVLERFTIDSQDILPKKFANQNKLFKFALVECELETGRTHQIRVHFSAIGRPLLGDRLYGSKPPKKPTIESMVIDYLVQEEGKKVKEQDSVNGGQLLHAAELGFEHPSMENKPMLFKCEPPQNFVSTLEKLRAAAKTYAKRTEEETDALAY